MSQAVYVRSMCTCVSIPVADFHRDKSGRQKINQLNDHSPVEECRSSELWTYSVCI